MLNHIGITLNTVSDIYDFYLEILEFKIEKHFEIEAEMAEKIFSIPEKTEVFLLRKEDLFLEVFISNKERDKSFCHLCLNYPNREKLISVIETKGYHAHVIPRKEYNLVFISDKSGNILEIKQLSFSSGEDDCTQI